MLHNGTSVYITYCDSNQTRTDYSQEVGNMSQQTC